MIQIYCGDGKGKTSAGIGAAVRAAGHHIPVVYAQFLKDDASGEISVLRDIPGIAVLHAAHHFGFWKSQSEEEREITRAEAAGLLQQVQDTMNRAMKRRPDADAEVDCLVVLDEVIGAVGNGVLEEDALLSFLRSLEEDVEVILTGRNPSNTLQSLADYVSEIHAVKHPYDKGISARIGVEL
ncbi:MAG: cob(I)yrinic acid a,c-diamide adenosyltransferase [Lachnospiraceae bacterium]|nr:cob(I)yrinic acid a,c-diamide adenosyltransferase [Lachnospiraceae bacterium]